MMIQTPCWNPFLVLSLYLGVTATASLLFVHSFQPYPLHNSISLPHTTTPYNQHSSRGSLGPRHSLRPYQKPFNFFLKSTATTKEENVDTKLDPQAIGTGYSQSPDLYEAIKEATIVALSVLPSPLPQGKIDLAKIYVTSIYDNQFSPSQIVPAVLTEIKNYYQGEDVVQNLIGCYSGGTVGSKLNMQKGDSHNSKLCSTMESEGVPGVVVTLCVLPDTKIKTFHILGDDVPDDFVGFDLKSWKNAIGLRNFDLHGSNEVGKAAAPSFMILSSPSFQIDLDNFLRTMKMCFGKDHTMFGAIASTVSSLSRARLFRYDVDEPGCIQTLADGCVGVAMSGDVQFNAMVAQGAKPVGGVYRVVAGSESTVRAIQLDEEATKQLEDSTEDEEEDNEDEGDNVDNKKKFNAAAYAKAIIPKPVLAEANYIMKNLSDDDQAFMRKSILIGIERSGGISNTPSELLRLAEGNGHAYTVLQVASAGMKDGSVTLPLGSVDVEPGARLRFFVRDNGFAKKEIEALWIGHKKKVLEQSVSVENQSIPIQGAFNPAGCFFFPTLDRGAKYFGEQSYESNAISRFCPTLPSISGFFSNGAIASLHEGESQAMIHGSASAYVLVGSKSKRPVYSHAKAKAKADDATKKELEDIEAASEDSKPTLLTNSEDEPAPRTEEGELLVRRREVHSGRALTVSSVEWSVVENQATATSALEGTLSLYPSICFFI